jgi:hypothetical protein
MELNKTFDSLLDIQYGRWKPELSWNLGVIKRI